MDKMEELERAAKQAQEHKRLYGGYLAFSDFSSLVTPEVILRLVAIARAAKMALDYHQGLAAITQSDLSKFDAALRESLEPPQ